MLQTILVMAILLPFLLFHLKSDYNRPPWAYACGATTIWLSVQLGLATSWTIGLFYCYLALNALYWGLFNFSQRRYMNPLMDLGNGRAINYEQLRLGPSTLANGVDAECMRTYAALTATGIGYLMLSINIVDTVIELIPALLFINTLLHKYSEIFRLKTDFGTKPPIQGFGANRSLDSTLCSLMFAIMLVNDYHLVYWLIAIPSLAYCLYKGQGTAGILGVGLSLSAWLFVNGYYELTGIIILAGIFVFYKYPSLRAPNGRVHIYKYCYDKFWVKAVKPFGIGMGSFKILMPQTGKIDVDGHKMTVSHLHSDIGQIPIEAGIVGSVLLVIMLIGLLVNMNPVMFVLACAVIPNVLFNFPMHLAQHVFFMLIMLKLSFQ